MAGISLRCSVRTRMVNIPHQTEIDCGISMPITIIPHDQQPLSLPHVIGLWKAVAVFMISMGWAVTHVGPWST